MITLDSRNTIPAQQFSIDEMNLMCIFPTTTKSILMQSIIDAQPWMVDAELSALARNTLFKLSQMTDDQFNSIQFIPVYDTEVSSSEAAYG